MKRRIFLLLLFVFAPNVCSADSLAVEDGGFSGRVSGYFDAIDIDLGVWPLNSPPNPDSPANVVIFDNMYFDTTSVGKSFFATPSTDSNFNSYSAYITDGNNEFHGYRVEPVRRGSDGSIIARPNRVRRNILSTEETTFSSLPGVGAQGYVIDSAEIFVKWLQLSYQDGDTSYDLGFTYRINGSQPLVTPEVTPEPSSMALFGLGAGVLGLSRRLRKKRR